MEFKVLGPLEVVDGQREIELRAAKQRILLAALLCAANSPVPMHRLEAALWGDTPPKTAADNLRLYVYHLRRALDDPGRIKHRSAGYMIIVRPDELDVLRFDDLAARGQAAMAAGDAEAAARLLGEALDLWRGQPFADLDHLSPFAEEADRLNERRQTVLEERIEADLGMGRHRDVTAELFQLVAQHPLRERLCGQLMLALYRSGRQAEALAAYRGARSRLVDELGLEPGEELRRLEQSILNADPGLAVAAAGFVVPRQLPAHTPHFVGRDSQLRLLDELVDTGSRVCVISGMAGVGKSALAVHWAHRAADRFDGGQLYVNLRGFDPASEPTSPAEAVRGFLDALAVPPDRIPTGLEAMTALYRSLMADRKMLVLLDNTRGVEQIRPLLPGGPACLVVATSRNQLAGLAVQEGARLVPLDLLSTNESVALLSRHLDDDRIDADAEATQELVSYCARLPLALAITAARATISPDLPLRVLCEELRGERTRLDAFDVIDPVDSLRAVFSLSYLNLDPPVARMFRLLGLHPGPSLSPAAAASLAGVPLPRSREMLRTLTTSNLVTAHGSLRFGLHDLLRAYAIEQPDDVTERRAALHRVLDHYLHTAYAGARLVEPTRDLITLPPPHPGCAPETMTSDEQALAWYETEHAVLMAAVRAAADTGFDEHAWRLPWALADYLNRGGHWHDLASSQHIALLAAQRLDDTEGQAHAHRELGRAYIRLASHREAEQHLRCALVLFQELDHEMGTASSHLTLGWLFEQQGEDQQSLTHAEHALRLYQAAGDRAGQANALNAIGWCHAQLGAYQQALARCTEALEMQSGLGDPLGEAATWDSLGYVHNRFGHHIHAVSSFERSLELYRRISDRYHEATILGHLGEANLASGAPDTARRNWEQAITILHQLHHPDEDLLRQRLRRLDHGTGTA